MSENLSSSDKAFAAFARFHSATMVPIFATGGWWPGFTYTDDEQAAMREQFAGLPHIMLRFYTFMICIAVPITLALMIVPVLIMAWILTALQHASGGPLPTLLFFSIFGATMAVGLGVMFPLGYYLSCLLYARRSNPSKADAEFGRRLFYKYCRQVGRIAVFVGFGCLVLSLWPESRPETSHASAPLPLWERSGFAFSAIGIKLATLRFYYLKGRQVEEEMARERLRSGPQ